MLHARLVLFCVCPCSLFASCSASCISSVQIRLHFYWTIHGTPRSRSATLFGLSYLVSVNDDGARRWWRSRVELTLAWCAPAQSNLQKKLDESLDDNDTSILPDVHATSAGLKSYCTWYVIVATHSRVVHAFECHRQARYTVARDTHVACCVVVHVGTPCTPSRRFATPSAAMGTASTLVCLKSMPTLLCNAPGRVTTTFVTPSWAVAWWCCLMV